MSKSYGNYIGINEPAADQFGKAMSVSDDLMWRYYELISSKSLDEIAALKKDVEEGRLHPKKAKEALAYEIVAATTARIRHRKPCRASTRSLRTAAYRTTPRNSPVNTAKQANLRFS